MIWTFILNAIISVVGAMLAFLPDVEVLPWGTDEFFVNSVGYYKYVALFFPPLTLFLTLTLIFLAYKLTIILAKFFLGARLPHL